MTAPVDLPASAAWVLRGARSGFDAVTIERSAGDWVMHGSTTALEDDHAWQVSYRIETDPGTVTRRAEARTPVGSRERHTVLVHDGSDRLLAAASPLDDPAPVPAAHVRVHSAEVERLDETYRRSAEDAAAQEHDRRYADEVPDGRFERVDAAHLIQAERPAVVADGVRQLLAL